MNTIRVVGKNSVYTRAVVVEYLMKKYNFHRVPTSVGWGSRRGLQEFEDSSGQVIRVLDNYVVVQGMSTKPPIPHILPKVSLLEIHTQVDEILNMLPKYTKYQL